MNDANSPRNGAVFYVLDPRHTDPARLKREREKARKLRQSAWWQAKLRAGLCHYCGQKFKPAELTMDHVVPLARGGVSAQSNLVPACKACNSGKKLSTPAEDAFAQLERERRERGIVFPEPEDES